MTSAFEAIPALFLILASFPLFAIAFLKIVGMMVEHEIDTFPGVVALGILFALLGTMCITKSPVIPWAILLVVSTSMAFYPFAAKQVSLLDHRRINRSSIEKYYEAWATRPDNAAAALSLAKALYDHGYREAGIAIADSTLSRFSKELDIQTMRSPRDMFRHEDILLQRWKSQNDLRQSQPLKCAHCGTSNDPAALQCSKCQRPHLLEAIRTGDSMAKLGGKLVLGFAIVAGSIVGTVAASLQFKGAMQSIVVVSGVGLVGLVFAWMFRQPRYDATIYRPIVSED